jgi:hypothetical protein
MSAADGYAAWIEADTANHKGWTRGRCQSAAHALAEAFPELRVVRGYCQLANGFTPQHWWCETADGTVIDPTAAQFEAEGIIGYDEYDEKKHGPLPIGKCMNCGFEVYNSDHQGLCSEECLEDFAAYWEREVDPGRGSRERSLDETVKD